MKFNLKKFVLILGMALFLVGVGLFIYLGYYNRYWADDWCYNADFKIKGFVQTVQGYSSDVTYTPSRYSVTIFAGLLQAFQVLGVQLMTPLTILLWLAGLIYLFYNIARAAGFKLPVALNVLVSSAIVYFSIYLSPQIYQSLYWRTGMLTYTTPLVFITWIFAILTVQISNEKPSPVLTTLLFVLAFFGGGFSEAGATVLVSLLGLYALIAGIGSYQKRPWAQKTFVPALVALTGALIAVSLLIFAPTTQIRKERYGEPTGLSELVILLYQFTYAFFVLSIKDYQNILLILMSFFLGFAFFPSREKTDGPVKILLLAAFVGLVGVLLVAASLTPSAYIEKGFPADRTMIIPRFIAVFTFVSGALLTGFALRQAFQAKWLETLVTVLLLASFAFPAYTLAVTARKIPIYAGRTQAWDVRNAEIQAALAAGAEHVEVQAIDGLPVGGIRDFDPQGKKGFWITKCAMNYYGLNLRVVLP